MKKIYGNKRVQKLVDSGKVGGGKIQFMDAYNQIIREDVVSTIKTNIDKSCMYFVVIPNEDIEDTTSNG